MGMEGEEGGGEREREREREASPEIKPRQCVCVRADWERTRE